VVNGPDSVTEVVSKAMSRTPDARLREVMDSLVRHLHGFVRETRLTEEEFEAAIDFLVRIGQASGPEKNEAILLCDLLGVSTLVSMLNNTHATGTDAALLGPFWRANAPVCDSGDSIARDAKGGEPLAVNGRVTDVSGKAVAGATVDVWQASPVGLYENQDDEQPDHNLRGRFVSDAEGRFHFRTVRPAGYPVPTDGPCGELLAAQRRHPFRPAHIPFMISKEAYKTLITQVFDNTDDCISADVVFGVTPALSGKFEPDGKGGWRLDYDFVMQPGIRRMPRPPLP
jgi:catechol 1,2-dioxygenase